MAGTCDMTCIEQTKRDDTLQTKEKKGSFLTRKEWIRTGSNNELKKNDKWKPHPLQQRYDHGDRLLPAVCFFHNNYALSIKKTLRRRVFICEVCWE